MAVWNRVLKINVLNYYCNCNISKIERIDFEVNLRQVKWLRLHLAKVDSFLPFFSNNVRKIPCSLFPLSDKQTKKSSFKISSYLKYEGCIPNFDRNFLKLQYMSARSTHQVIAQPPCTTCAVISPNESIIAELKSKLQSMLLPNVIDEVDSCFSKRRT